MTTNWSPREAQALTARQEVQVVTRRRDGSLRRPTTIWIVGDGDRVFVRSTNGPTAGWYREAIATDAGQIVVAGTAYDVGFVKVEDDELMLVDRAYRAKYGRYASIVDYLVEDEPRSATLEVRPG
ncbi:MAG TPA: DUF2255 family protein [Nakamurella sp.]